MKKESILSILKRIMQLRDMLAVASEMSDRLDNILRSNGYKTDFVKDIISNKEFKVGEKCVVVLGMFVRDKVYNATILSEMKFINEGWGYIAEIEFPEGKKTEFRQAYLFEKVSKV